MTVRRLTPLSRIRLQASPDLPFTPRLVHWSITDPAGSEESADQGLELMRRVRDDIADQVSRLIAGIGPTAVSPIRQRELAAA